MASGYNEAALYRQKSPSQESNIRFLIQCLLKNKRPLTVHEIASRYKLKEPDLIRLIDSAPAIFERYDDGRSVYMKLICSLSICETHCVRSKHCSGIPPICTGLHICKYYILSDSCRFGEMCHFGHDLTTTHNNSILKEFLLDGFPVEDIKSLMKQTDCRTATTVPKICKFFNNQSGCRNLGRGKTCPYLHICKHYIHNNCQFGKGCKRSHNILEPATISVLNKHGIDTKRTPKEILTELREAMESGIGSEASSVDSVLSSLSSMSVEVARGPVVERQGNQRGGQVLSTLNGHQLQATGVLAREFSLDSTSDHQTICLYNLKGRCAYGKSCHKIHCDMPYQWLYRDAASSEKWQSVDAKQNLEIEMSYSGVDESNHVLQVDGRNLWVKFKTMTAHDDTGHRGYKVLRLSTDSSVEITNQPLATVWIWSWKTQIGAWKQYGVDADGYSTTIQSTDIEQEYLANPTGKMKFATQGHEYELDFEKMVQCNLQYKTPREVRRRPKFVTVEEVERKKRQPNHLRKTANKKGQKTAPIAMVTAPLHWDIGENEDILDHYKQVKLLKRNQDTRREYKEIEALFSGSMPSTATITSITRIQNGDLWTNYIKCPVYSTDALDLSKKAKMEKKKKGAINEKRLFHGTQSHSVEGICQQGFDFRLSGQASGTKFGKGSYFAASAQYSSCYTSRDDPTLFVVTVLVGEYVKGDPKYPRPPPKRPQEPQGELYDSCVDDERNPGIFVIFDNNGQVYPEYVIKYQMQYQL